jgi:hypothetical protein
MMKGDTSMADRMQKRSAKDMEIKFGGKIEFEGSVSEFKTLMAGLQRLSDQGLKIGTWPTPERPAIGGIPLPELMCHIPWPRPFPGFIDIPRYLGKDLLEKLIEGKPRFKVIKDIDGGIRTAHLHLHDEVVLLEEAGFKEAVQRVAAELAGQLAETAEYDETIGAIRHLTPGMR